MTTKTAKAATGYGHNCMLPAGFTHRYDCRIRNYGNKNISANETKERCSCGFSGEVSADDTVECTACKGLGITENHDGHKRVCHYCGFAPLICECSHAFNWHCGEFNGKIGAIDPHECMSKGCDCKEYKPKLVALVPGCGRRLKDKEVHPSHTMTKAVCDIRSPTGGEPRFYSVRYCKKCEAEEQKASAGELVDDELYEVCGSSGFRAKEVME